MVKADRFKDMSRKQIFRTTFFADPTNKGSIRRNEPLEEAESESSSIAEELIDEILSKTDELIENEKVHQKSGPQPIPAFSEIRDVAWLIVNRVFLYCKGKEFFIFGLIVGICFSLLCIQLALIRKSLHEIGAEQRGDIVNKLVMENEKFKNEVLAKIHEVGTEQMGDMVNKLITKNEDFKREVLARIEDVDEGHKKSGKFESLLLNISAFHNKLLKELKRREQTLQFDEASSSGEDGGKESLVSDKEEEITNEGKKTRGWLETINCVVLCLSPFFNGLLVSILYLLLGHMIKQHLI